MSPAAGKHHRVSSSLEDLTILELDFPVGPHTQAVVKEVDPVEAPQLPNSTLVIVAETDKIHEDKNNDSATLVAALADFDFTTSTKLKVTDWDPTSMKGYSEYIKDGMEFLKKDPSKVVMLFESPSSSTTESSFHNNKQFKFHDWPPPKSTMSKAILGPCKYSMWNGSALPVFLRGGKTPTGLEDHWKKVMPENLVMPRFVDKVSEDDVAYAYLPVEQIKNHVNDPDTHYHLAGKDAIHLMTQKTTKLLPDTRTSRPCVVKTTHSMGSKGIFIIRNDEDEAEFEQFLQESGNPTFVITDFVDIKRNIACHFFMHPDGKNVTWFGSNENKRLPDGSFSTDSYLEMKDQKSMKEMQLPFVEEVVQYCENLGFWGFCGIDVLFDSQENGYMVDINPRVTGSCPALMTLQLFNKKYGFEVGLFRRGGDINYYGTMESMMEEVDAYNTANEGKSRILIHSAFQPGENHTRMNIGVYGFDMDECKAVLNRFAQPKSVEVQEDP
ncbi:ATP-grasp domain [Seminavis robusta]|uniref:ATP-grasp domain n=1 Tax=Seminavis robusta TaxID=568900 RepID=A0A9N8ECC4_9STRA|nr:ATP-grasp domain [Seminavis robusta]|eukprot:Sro798_g204030.1 ATP-grasp domain (497) ;mRNA; r:39681-41171